VCIHCENTLMRLAKPSFATKSRPARLDLLPIGTTSSRVVKGSQPHIIEIDGDSLTLGGLEAVAQGAGVAPAAPAYARMERSLAVTRRFAEGSTPAYGINTGFGRLVDVRITPGDVSSLQANIVRSHAAGVGEPFDEPTARAIVLLRANVLLKGYSGVRPLIVEQLCALLNSGVYPVIPSKGSVGASGDLAPLAHLALLLMGEGEGVIRGVRLPGGMILFRLGLEPVVLGPKEGLALVNGTQAMTAMGALDLLRAERLVETAEVAGALTLEALRGSRQAFRPELHALRPHPGQVASAQRLYGLLEDSAIMESHRDCGKVQDAYSLRCMPQVHGAVRDTLAHARRVLEIELNAATDNPLVFADGGPGHAEGLEGEAANARHANGVPPILSGGNFHGAPVAYVLDFMSIALTDLAAISERRIERLVNPDLSDLPPFLATNPGLESGLMMAQVTAAALVSGCKSLAHPASVDSIPTSANKEDHVSMGVTAALKLRQILDDAERVLAIELLCAARALQFLEPLTPARPLQPFLERLRTASRPSVGDRPPSRDIEEVASMVRGGAFASLSNA
jgi:histidine ammonia-lyase